MARHAGRKPGPGSGMDHTPLRQERIVESAMKLLQESGLQGLSMRNLADALGVKAAALYWHVRNKEELMQLIADRICGEIYFLENAFTWQEQIRHLMSRFRELLLKYRDSAHILAETAPITSKRTALIQKIFRTFESVGFNEEDSVMAGALLNNYVIGFVIDEVRIGDPTRLQVFLEGTQISQPSMDWIFPPMDTQFRFGLETLLLGLDAKLANSHIENTAPAGDGE